MSTEPEPLPDDAACLPLLEQYLGQLHAGERPNREKILADRPDLAGLLDCLDSLERLVPRDHGTADPATLAPSPTRAADGTGVGDVVMDLGRFEVLAEVGRGGMGVVYRARQKDLGRLVALKMILGSLFASQEEIGRFHKEARAAARLQHPNIVQVFETGESHGHHYYAMEYIEGASLAEVLRNRPPSLEQSVEILIQVARAVDYLHRRGIIHRDLKPANILLSEDATFTGGNPSDRSFTPKITDFGLAKLEGDSRLTRTGAVLGTPAYMSPEQAAGNKELGPATDIYSMGAILYEVLTGRPPFREATPLDTLVQVVEGEPTLPHKLNRTVPPELELVCMKCLDKSPERRYASATELAEDLRRFLEGEPVVARPQGPVQRLRRWSRREPALAARLIGLVLFAGVLQLGFMLDPHSSSTMHYSVLGVIAGWGLLSWVCQRLLRRPAWADVTRVVWSSSEPFLVTVLLWLTDNAGSVLVAAYPVFIAAAGLWFRVQLVWWTTAATVAAFALLVALSPSLQQYLHHDIIAAVLLIVLGEIVVHQVDRMRALSKHYASREQT